MTVEIFQPVAIYCRVGKTRTTSNVKGGKVVHDAKGFVESVCPGCQHWTERRVEEADDYVEREWGSEHVHRGRVNRLEQHFVERSRHISPDEPDNEPGAVEGAGPKIIVMSCTPIGAE